MFRKTLFAVLTAASSIASAQSNSLGFDPNTGYPPTPGAYGNPDTGGLDDSRFDYRRAQNPNGSYNGYNPATNPNPNGGYAPQTPGLNTQPNPRYSTEPTSPTPGYNGPTAGSSPIDMRSVQLTNARSVQIAVPQGWKLIDQQNLTLAVSPTGTSGYGIVSGIDLPGQASPEQYFSTVFPKVMQIPGVQIAGVKPGQSQNGMQSAIVQFAYAFQGQQYIGMATVTTHAGQNGTRGMISVVAGTQSEMQANAGAMIQLLQSIRPAAQNDTRPVGDPTERSGNYGTPVDNRGYGQSYAR